MQRPPSQRRLAHLGAAVSTPSLLASAVAGSTTPRVMVVTGANKGIGKAIALALAQTPGLHCIATARNEQLGREAVRELVGTEGVPAGSISFRQLDLDSPESIEDFASWLQTTHGEIGALINNAGISFNSASPEPFSEQATPTVYTNFLQTRLLTDTLLPLVSKADGRVVFVASGSGTTAFADASEDLQRRVRAATRDDLTEMAEEFVSGAKAGGDSYEGSGGYPSSCYGVSKMLLIRYSQLLAEEVPQGLLVNAMCTIFD